MRAHEATAGGVKICKHAKVITVFSTSKGRGSFLFAALPFQSFIVEFYFNHCCFFINGCFSINVYLR